MVFMVPVPISRLQASQKEEIENWPYLDEGTLQKIRSRKLCMTFHCSGSTSVNCIPLGTIVELFANDSRLWTRLQYCCLQSDPVIHRYSLGKSWII